MCLRVLYHALFAETWCFVLRDPHISRRKQRQAGALRNTSNRALTRREGFMI
ncbi:uncharacterized protein K444DRAFT_608328 [Hyaloscypha bicolor E]|uniref:Uncharacterized protein n=1 Tax=Hyaloscypha bicolor E TaxID=1095630 RepID=A0A2J6TNN1_9HELO|nr:uncharacterized protein K444DRAFT_608328 [Hyaloscypha bicolor E]PMD64620.1 hypothetical protein K444DRAFT_608328 [Hyaloscypha bicolor E]